MENHSHGKIRHDEERREKEVTAICAVSLIKRDYASLFLAAEGTLKEGGYKERLSAIIHAHDKE